MPYLDDTIIHSDTFANHLRNLDLVLAAHVKAGQKNYNLKNVSSSKKKSSIWAI